MLQSKALLILKCCILIFLFLNRTDLSQKFGAKEKNCQLGSQSMVVIGADFGNGWGHFVCNAHHNLRA